MEKIDFVTKLPVEIAEKVLAYLSTTDLENARNCTQRWRLLISNDLFWKVKCEHDNIFLTEETSKSEIYKKMTEKFGYWRGLYLYYEELDKNFRNGNYEKILIEKQFSSHKFHYFDDEIIIETALNEIKLINYSDGIVQHSFPIEYDARIGWGRHYIKIVKNENWLVCATNVRLKAWNIESRENVLDVELQICVLMDIKVYKNIIAIAEETGLSIIDIHSGTTIFELANVNFVSFHNDWVVMQFRSIETAVMTLDEMCVRKIPYQKVYFEYTLFRDHYMILFESEYATVWNLQTLSLLNKIGLRQCQNQVKWLDNHTFMCVGIFDKEGDQYRIKVSAWNFLTGENIFDNTHILLKNPDNTFGIGRYTFFFYDSPKSSKRDGKVKILNATTSECITKFSAKVLVPHKNIFDNDFPLITETKMLVTKRCKNDDERYLELYIYDFEKKIVV